jgi:hypothetical protein
VGKTYFAQWMNSIPEVDKLATNDISAVESWLEPKNIYFDRKNRIYNHLLARFGEDLNDLPWKVALRLNIIKNEAEFNQILLQEKSEFLLQIKKLSYNRTKGESILHSNSKGINQESFRKPSGLEQMILAKTGIPTRGNKSLVPEFAELKMHLHKIKEEPLRNDEELNLKFRSLRTIEIYNWEQTDHLSNMPNAMFGKISLKALFKETLNYNNYRLSIPKSAADIVRVIFQKEKNTWVSLFESTNEAEAVEKIHQLIDYFINQNIKSEGIYFIDHILLSDFLNDSKYGFCFYDEKGKAILQTKLNESWSNTEEDRNECLKKLYEFGENESSYCTNNGNWMIKDIEGNILVSFNKRNSDIKVSKLLKKTKSSIRLFNCSENSDGRLRFNEMEKIRKKGSFFENDKYNGQKRLVFQRRLSNGKTIDEDFFNLNISVLMPDWPARFQVERFKDYVADLIKERIPAHIGNDILWINALEMKAFEDKYHIWEKLKSEVKNSKSHSQKVKTAAYKVYQMLMELKKNK